MKVEELSQEEKKWLKQFKALMKKCPSKRLGAYIGGDPYLTIYDKEVFDAYRKAHPHDERDDVFIHGSLGTVLDTIKMPFPVDGVCV